MVNFITNITDRAAYVELGRQNTTPGSSYSDTYVWAGECTLAAVWDDATVEECDQAVAWIREGERTAAGVER